MLKLLHPESSEIEDGGGKLSSTPLTISNQSLPDQQLPCIFLRWNLGLPRKLFLIELSRDLQWTAEGEPGGVGSSCSVSPPGSKISNIQIRGKFRFNQNTSFLGILILFFLLTLTLVVLAMLPVVSLDLGRGEGGVRRHWRGGQRHGQTQRAERGPAGLPPPVAETQRITLF